MVKITMLKDSSSVGSHEQTEIALLIHDTVTRIQLLTDLFIQTSGQTSKWRRISSCRFVNYFSTQYDL